MRQSLTSNIKLKISIGFILAMCAFIIVQLLSNKSIEKLKLSVKDISENRQLSRKIGSILSSVKSYHSSIAEFVVTGNEKFLSGNEELLIDINNTLQNILATPMTAEQGAIVRQLDSIVKAEMTFYQQTLIEYNKANTAKSIALINTGIGEQYIKEINSIAKKLRQIEETNLETIMQRNDSFSRNITQMDYAATGFAVMVILFSILILFRDINKRIMVERQLRIAQQKAEQSALMKENFMANMSHEIRTPMNAIIGFANLLSKSKLDDVQKSNLYAIQSSGENLLNIVNDILDFSKIEAGMVNIEKIPFSPASLLHSLNVMFLPKANDKKLQLNFYTSMEMANTVIGDPSRLTQILVNLINNAIKFTSEGSIAVKSEILKTVNQDVFLQFTVKDTGIGIPIEKQSEIFERFIQANTDTNRKYGGTGLGLSIVKKLVEIQDGVIKVDSAEGVGSSFTFVIPYKKESPKSVPEIKEPGIPVLDDNIKILVAEDNMLNQHLAASLLSQWDFSFDIVDNGKLVIEKLKQNKYDLILMDIQMPEMNGYDTAKAIRQELGLNLPIIAMTAHVMPGEKDKCLGFGMNDYISKPIRETELYSLIARHISDSPDERYIQLSKQDKVVINLDYVNELSNGNTNFVSEMIDLFISENPKDVELLESSILKKDFAGIQATSHKMNSTAPFVGLNLVIGKQLSSIERLAENKMNITQIEFLFKQVKDICSKAIEELNQLKTYNN